MTNINQELKKYIEENIFPIYSKNDKGHSIDHINYVIKRSLEFANSFPNLNIDMVYTIAAFHDIAHHIDKDNHETLSAKVFYENNDMKKFFTEEERLIIKEAIEDHRASLGHTPRSTYGKIVSSADRETSVSNIILKTHNYSLKHYSDMSIEEMINRAHNVIKDRIDNLNKYPTYVKDPAYDNFIKTMKDYIDNYDLFKQEYLKITKSN